MKLRAAEWEVRDIDHALAKVLVEQHHYAGGGSRTRVYTHGLFKIGDPECKGVAWWLPPTRNACESVNKEHWRKVLSLTRLVVVPGVPTNACSFLLGRSVKLIKADDRFVSLVTYADESQDHTGTIYRAANWHYVGRTGPYPRWVDPLFERQVAVLSTTSRSTAQMRDLGYVREGRFYKHKFVLHLPAKPRSPLREFM